MSNFITNGELRIEAERLCDENERLEAENAKLRTQLADVTASMGRVEERCAKLRVERDEWHRVAVSKQDVIDHMHDARTENSKLLELLKNALTYIEYEGCGVECPGTGNSATLTPCDTCNRYETESCAYVIAQSARELGLEAE